VQRGAILEKRGVDGRGVVRRFGDVEKRGEYFVAKVEYFEGIGARHSERCARLRRISIGLGSERDPVDLLSNEEVPEVVEGALLEAFVGRSICFPKGEEPEVVEWTGRGSL
jgi:hypothetical protein